MHLSRQKVPKIWPLERKGTAYVVKPLHSLNKGIPILVILRDILEITKNRREAKKAIFKKQILVNGKPIKSEKDSVLLFDTISIISLDGQSKLYYRIDLGKNKKLTLNQIDEKESKQKVSKIINKKCLKGHKIQINLSDGMNVLSDTKCNVNDSVIIDFKNNKIAKHLPLKEKSNAVVFAGKHTGQRGMIESIDKKDSTVKISSKEGEINVLIKQVIVTQ